LAATRCAKYHPIDAAVGVGPKKTKNCIKFFKNKLRNMNASHGSISQTTFYKMSWFIERFKSELYDGVVNNQIKKGLLPSV